MSDQTTPHYAIMRTIRIRSWSHACWAGDHNARTMDVPNAEADAPAPIHFIGKGDVLDELRAAHRRFNPKMVEDAVLGLEFIFSASPDAFEGLEPGARYAKAIELTKAAREYLRNRFPHEGQIVSMTLHLDETTPHPHAVVIPVHKRADARTGEREYWTDEAGKRRWRTKAPEARAEEWMLSADRDMGWKGDLAKHQTDWAKQVEHLGLVRGRRRSGARNITNREHAAILDERVAHADRARDAAKAERDAAARERGDLAERMAALDAVQAELERLAAVLADKEASLAVLAAELAAVEAKVLAAGEFVTRQAADVEARAQKTREWEREAKERTRAMDDRGRAQDRRDRALDAQGSKYAVAISTMADNAADIVFTQEIIRAAVGYDNPRLVPELELLESARRRMLERTERHPAIAAAVAAQRDRRLDNRAYF